VFRKVFPVNSFISIINYLYGTPEHQNTRHTHMRARIREEIGCSGVPVFPSSLTRSFCWILFGTPNGTPENPVFRPLKHPEGPNNSALARGTRNSNQGKGWMNERKNARASGAGGMRRCGMASHKSEAIARGTLRTDATRLPARIRCASFPRQPSVFFRKNPLIQRNRKNSA